MTPHITIQASAKCSDSWNYYYSSCLRSGQETWVVSSTSDLFSQVLLLLCGDVEQNPGPPGRREPKPDKAKIMADKVEAHEAKFEELTGLIKSQAELIETLTSKQVELEKALEDKQVEATSRLEEMKVALEASLEETKVQAEKKLEEEKVLCAQRLQGTQVEFRELRQTDRVKQMRGQTD